MAIKFIGEHIAKLDDKGRLVFPAQFKAIMERNGARKLYFVLKKNLFSQCLDMYTSEEWDQHSEAVRARLNTPFNRKHDILWREYSSNRALVEPDEKTGRIQIPKRLLEMIEVRKEVVFSGNDHKIEVWAKEHYQENKLSESEYVALAEEILG